MKAILSFTVLLISILLISNSFLYSQSAIEIENYIENKELAKSTDNDVENLKGLYYDFNTTAVLSKGNVKIVGKNSPKVIFIDLFDLDAVYEKNSNFADIEMIIISIQDENSAKLDLKKLEHFQNLDYIVFKSDKDVSSNKINSLVINTKDVNYTLLYDISIAQ